MPGEVHVTGVGLVSKFGNNLEEFWNALKTQGNYEKENSIPEYITSYEEYKKNYERYFLNLCTEAISRAIKDAHIEKENLNGCIIVGTGMGLADSFLSQKLEPNYMSLLKMKLQEKLKTKINIIIMANACCAGAQAIAYAYDLIRTGKYDYVVAGGAEAYSYITDSGFYRLNCIDENGCRPFDKNRKGITVGDGAAFFVVERYSNIHTYCEMLGHGITCEAYHVVSPKPDGTEIKNSIQNALRRAELKPENIDAVIAHGTGTKQNDSIEGKVLWEVFKEIDVTAPKGKIGHTGGASGAFGLLTALCLLKYQEIPPVMNLRHQDDNINIHAIKDQSKKKDIHKVLINCLAFGGTNVVLLCGRGRKKTIVTQKSITISEKIYQETEFCLSGSRTMDPFTKKILYTVHQLFQGDFSPIDKEKTGVALSTRTGAFTSLTNIADVVAKHGYKSINPSLFPNVMLSTALSQLAIYCGIHGPSCAFYDMEGQGTDALDYCKLQINDGYCNAMILISGDENGLFIGRYITRKDL